MEAAMKLPHEAVEIENKVLTVPEQAKSILITDAPSYAAAGEILLKIKDFRKEIDASYDPIIKKAHETHKEAVAQKKKVEAPLLEAESIIKPRMAYYIQEQEKRRLAEEARIREEAKKKEEEDRLSQAIQAESDGLVPEEVDSILETPTFSPPRILPSATPKVTGIAPKTTWKFRIVNPKLIPREYLIPDEKAIGGIARSLGERANIPGVEFYPEMNISAGRR